jgi:PKD repeat protein
MGSPAPVADFTGVPTSGTAPLTVVFTDNSTNKPTTWNWSFGDGNFSTTQDPDHTYQSNGTYTVALTATNDKGSNRVTKSNYIIVGNISRIGVYRPSTHLFYLDYNGNGAWNGTVTDREYNFGIVGDIPVTGDWNADGRTEIGVYRPSTHLYYQDYNGNGVWNGALIDKAYNFGITGDLPVSGDWDGDWMSEIGVYRPSTHLYYQDYNGNGVWNGSVIDRAYNFGITGDTPVSGKWV